MSEANMKKYAQSKWDSFWANLKAGYDFFESSKSPSGRSSGREEVRVWQSNELMW